MATSSPKITPCLDSRPTQRRSRRLTFLRHSLPFFLCLLFLGLFYNPAPDAYRRLLGRNCHGNVSSQERARQILSRTPLIDGHVDFAMAMRQMYRNKVEPFTSWARRFDNGTLEGHVDLHRLRQGRAGGAFWSVYAPCPAKADDMSDQNLAQSVQYTLDQIDITTRVFSAYPQDFALGLSSSDAINAFKSGKLISPLAVEGLHQCANSASNLRLFHQLGVRYATLTHNCHNIYADAALLENPLRKAKPLWRGVSDIGRQMIREMNRIGMIVDLSHTSDDTMRDVLGAGQLWNGSEAPVIFSHSSAYSLCPHPRNVKDDVLRLVKDRNSLVMINIYPGFISCVADDMNANGIPKPVPELADLNQIVRHILHIGNLIGYDHVGIGTDFDGIDEVPRGFEDVTKYPDLVAALLEAGVSDSDAEKVIGRNLIRVWKAVDEVSAKMKAAKVPAFEDDRKP